jgi:hypothetical protein
MPTTVGPNTFGEENLVFGYDLGDTVNSYKGEPTINYVPGTYSYGLYAYVSGPVDTAVLNEKNKSVTAKRYTITQAVNTARAAIFPSTTTAVSYTFSFKWKYNGTTTATPSITVSAAKGYPETNTNSFTSQVSDTVAIGNGWYLTTYTFVFSSNPNSACILTFGISTGSTASYVGETFDIYEAQFEIKNRRTQYSNGTRSNTQGLLDLTGNSSIDLGSVSFDSTVKKVFDGTDDLISIVSNGITDYSQPFTMECVFKVDSGATWDNGYRSNIFGIAGSYAGMYGLFKYNNSGVGIQLRDATTTAYAVVSSGLSKGVYYHLVGTWDGTNQLKLYLNGALAQSTATTMTGATDTPNLYIGGLRAYGGAGGNYYQGEIPIAKYYNRALQTLEVRANYNAIKGRFKI